MSAANTNFLNSQGRRIVKGAKGAYFVKRADGTKVYGLRAAFRKVGANGAKVKLTKANIASVPSPLRRAVRKNAGVKRKSPAVRKAPVRRVRAVRSPNQGLLQRKMNNEAKRLALARARRALKPAPVRRKRSRSRSNEPKARRRPVARKNGAVRTIPARRKRVAVRRTPLVAKSPLMLMMTSQANINARARSARLARARARRALKPRVVRKSPVRLSPGQLLRRKQNALAKRRARAASIRAKRSPRRPSPMISSPGGTVYKSKRSMAAKKKALSRVKAMNDLLKAISPNPFSMLLNKPKRRRAAKK